MHVVDARCSEPCSAALSLLSRRPVIIVSALRTKPAWGPALVLVTASASAGCLDDTDESLEGASTTCGADHAYTPYARSAPSGSVVALPWLGETTSYPNGRESFDVYASGSTIECASDKDQRAHLDVTAGCLTAVTLGDGEYHRARVEPTSATHAFRAVALGYIGSEPIKWTDQRSEYRFYYAGEAEGTLPGFKIFARYRSEDDLYVGSWRFDGVIQIQKKQCGAYTILAKVTGPPPSPKTWHRIRFDAIGDQLTLYIDDKPALSATSPTFSWGTVGIRIDGATDAYLDNWRVF